MKTVLDGTDETSWFANLWGAIGFGLARTDNSYNTFYCLTYVIDDGMRVKRTCFTGEMLS